MAATNRTIALVTGANQGIGFATAKRLAAEHGYYVIMAGWRPDGIQSAAKSLIEQNLAVEGVVLDVKSNESIDTVFEHVQRKFGHLDVLVNNAGIARSSNEVSNDVRLAYEEIITTNVIGTMAMTERFLPLLARSQQVKRVVFVSSGAGSMTHWATPSSPTRRFKAPAYAVSKSPVNALCLQYAVTYEADKSWKFNCCCPGYCSTNLNGYTGLNTPESGADIVCRLATLDYTGSSGTFRNSQGIIPW